MKIALIVAAAIMLSGCVGGVGGGAQSQASMDLFKQILTAPNCAHDDKIAVVTGGAGIPASVTASAERHCPQIVPPKPGAPSSSPN